MAVEVGTAYVSLLPSARGFAAATKRELVPATTAVGREAGKKSGEAFGKGFVPSLHGIAVSFGILAGVDVFGRFVGEARDAAKAGRITQQVIKSTGGVAHVSAAGVTTLSDALRDQTGIDDDVVRGAANLLLTFRNVRNEVGKGNDIFNRATAATLDMSTALGTDAHTAALQLGKALGDPVKGLTALRRAGVLFTAGQQTQIKDLVKHGKLLQAQKLILGEVGKEFGGAAKAADDPIRHLGTTVNDLGKKVALAALPAIEKIAKVIEDTIPKVIAFGTALFDHIKPFLPIIQQLAPYILIAAAAFKVITIAVGIFNAILAINPITLIVLGLAVLAAGLVFAWQHFETFRNIVTAAWNVIKAVAAVAWAALKVIFTAIVTAIGLVITAAMWLWHKAIVPAFNGIKAVIQAAWIVLAPIFTVWVAIVRGIGTTADWLWKHAIGPAFRGIVAVIQAAWKIARPILAVWQAILDGIINSAKAVSSFVSGPTFASTHPGPNTPRGAAGGSPHRAAGGSVWPGQSFWVGEHGRELVRFGAPGMVFPHGSSAAARGGDNINIYSLDPDEILRVLANGRRRSEILAGAHA